ncbi:MULTISPECIES: SAM-dependent methyltransferase [unclassified Streptomyces]|uniref:SAM-dependent methyltransferase n=1 Tax=unclassified Streptomyces TaxID=2593676 RepID=UPI00382C5B2A
MSNDLARDVDLQTDRPHSARFWNYLLGGKDNYLPDQELGELVKREHPVLVAAARASRAFLGRSIRHLATDAGIRQFLDLGTGLPTADNTHEVAQRAAPASRIVYVDHDPIVLAHARALLTSNAEGATDYVDADLTDPETVLAKAERTLDLTQPVGLIILSTIGHVEDATEAAELVQNYMSRLVSGSYLALCTSIDSPAMCAAADAYSGSGAPPYRVRTAAEIEACAAGLVVPAPGLAPINRWFPETGADQPDVDQWGYIARKA